MIPCVCALIYLTGRLDTLRKIEACEEAPDAQAEPEAEGEEVPGPVVEAEVEGEEEGPGQVIEEVPRDGQVKSNFENPNIHRESEKEAEHGKEQGEAEAQGSKEDLVEDRKNPSNPLPSNNPHSPENYQVQRGGETLRTCRLVPREIPLTFTSPH